jgi:hypothetical protein
MAFLLFVVSPEAGFGIGSARQTPTGRPWFLSPLSS